MTSQLSRPRTMTPKPMAPKRLFAVLEPDAEGEFATVIQTYTDPAKAAEFAHATGRMAKKLVHEVAPWTRVAWRHLEKLP